VGGSHLHQLDDLAARDGHEWLAQREDLGHGQSHCERRLQRALGLGAAHLGDVDADVVGRESGRQRLLGPPAHLRGGLRPRGLARVECRRGYARLEACTQRGVIEVLTDEDELAHARLVGAPALVGRPLEDHVHCMAAAARGSVSVGTGKDGV
jgi:hypothetical protein